MGVLRSYGKVSSYGLESNEEGRASEGGPGGGAAESAMPVVMEVVWLDRSCSRERQPCLQLVIVRDTERNLF